MLNMILVSENNYVKVESVKMGSREFNYKLNRWDLNFKQKVIG